MSTRDEILANFQACSGIEDYGEAFSYLDSCNWDLVQALNRAIPDQTPDLALDPIIDEVAARPMALEDRFSCNISSHHEAELIDLDTPTKVESGPSLPSVSVSNSEVSSLSHSPGNLSSLPAVLDINIQVLCNGASEGNSFPLELPGSTTVGELQTMLYQLVGIPPCSQILEGFLKPVQPQTVITPNLLPKNMTLTINTSSLNNSYERLNGAYNNDNYLLLIHDELSGKDYNLSYTGSKLIRELKADVFHLTNILVRHQLWTGWPGSIQDQMSLSSSGISKEHHLTVSQQVVLERTPKSQRKNTGKNTGSEENSSGDEFEDASSELPEDDFLIMCDVPTAQRSQALIPANTDDELDGVSKFVEGFSNRYGPCIPLFFLGTLEDALKNSVMLPAKNRKLLAVYLHHDSSVLSNVFCSQTLCHMSMVDYLTNNFITWGWDMTHESNKSRLMNLVTSHFGVIAASTVRSFNVDKLPVLLIVTRTRGSIEVLSVINGNAVLDEVMTSLLHSFEMFEEQRHLDAVEEDAREQREMMMAEQDAAYHASLEADRAKAEAKRRVELEEREEKERQQSIREQETLMKEAVRQSLEMDLPPEPDSDCMEATTTFRFRVPDREPFERTFTRSTPLKTVLNYLCVKGYPADEFKYLQSWPRRCITSLDISLTLNDLKLPNQETLTVEERLETK